MITEDMALSVKHNTVDGLHVFVTDFHTDRFSYKLITVDSYDACPYCGSDGTGEHYNALGWIWGRYRCGSSAAIGNGRAATIGLELIGISPQSAECLFISSMTTPSDGDIV